MKPVLKKLSLSFSAMFLCSLMFAQNVDVKTIVNPDFYDELIQDGFVIRMRDDGSKGLKIIPEGSWNAQIENSMVEKKEGNYPFTYEALYILNKKEILKNNNSSAKTIEISDVSKVCRSISKMQGMKYYSSTRKKEVVLYEKAFTVENANSSTPIPDKTSGSADGMVLYAYQDDNSFGVNHYKLQYYEKENELLATFYLQDVMGIGPFKAIYPGDMIINLHIVDCGENLLLYICTDLDSVKFPGIKGQITDSISTRMDAIYKWFLKQF